MRASTLDRYIRRKLNIGDRWYYHRYRLTNQQYHSITQAVSSTGLKAIYKGNPAYCLEKYIRRSLPDDDTPAKLIGRATHKLILEYRSFKKDFAIIPQVDKRTKAGKAIWAEFKEQHPGKEYISQEDYDDIRRMRDAVMRHPQANQLLSGGEAERSVVWMEENTDIPIACRARCDYIKGNILIDLKTCLSAQPEEFTRDLIRMKYPIQEAHYRQGFSECSAFAFIAVEKGDFNTVEVYDLDDIFDECGYLMWQEALEKWAKCVKDDHWPTYRGGITTLDCPPYFANKIIGA